MLTSLSPNAADYDWWHPIISFLPIVAIIVLRNATDTLRSYHSALFVWLGQRWLEISVLSQHALSAADGRGVLGLGLWRGDGSVARDRWRDLAVLVPVLLFFAHQAADAADIVAHLLVEPEAETKHQLQPLPMYDRGATRQLARKASDPIDEVWKPATSKVHRDPKLQAAMVLGVLWLLNLLERPT